MRASQQVRTPPEHRLARHTPHTHTHTHTHTHSLMQLSHTASHNQEPTHRCQSCHRHEPARTTTKMEIPPEHAHQKAQPQSRDSCWSVACKPRCQSDASILAGATCCYLTPPVYWQWYLYRLRSGISTVLRIHYASEELLTDVDRPRSGSRIQGGVNFCRRFLSS